MSEMVERVARAFCIGMGVNPDGKDKRGKPTWQDMLPGARAAIAAMREPTEDMFYAGRGGDYGLDAASVWRAMIDEALK